MKSIQPRKLNEVDPFAGHGEAITQDATERLHAVTEQAYEEWKAGGLRGPDVAGVAVSGADEDLEGDREAG
jgi:hypothetical protein